MTATPLIAVNARGKAARSYETLARRLLVAVRPVALRVPGRISSAVR